MKNLYLFLCFVAMYAQSAQAQWQSHTPAFTDTIGIADVHALDQNTFFAVGQIYGVNDTFYSFGVPSDVHFMRSIDGGATSTVHKIPLPVAGAPFIANMAATDANTAYVIGLSDFANAFTLKTTDGGATWVNANTPWDAVKSWPDYIHAFTAAKICVIGDPRDGEYEIYNSVNGGQFWQPVPGASIPDPLAGEFGFNNIGSAINNTIWFGTSAGRIYRSKNAGLTWEAFQTPLASSGLMSFSDEQNGILTGGTLTTSQLFATTDGGATWTDITPTDDHFRITGISTIPNSPYVIMNRSTGSVLNSANFSTWISTNRGATWQQIGTGDNVGSLAFLSGTVGFGGEYQQLSHKTKVFKYTGSPLVGLFQPKKLDLEISLMPNPATDQISFDWPTSMSEKEAVILVNDASGRLLHTSKTGTAGRFSIDVSGYATGMYLLTVTTAEGSAGFKFTK